VKEITNVLATLKTDKSRDVKNIMDDIDVDRIIDQVEKEAKAMEIEKYNKADQIQIEAASPLESNVTMNADMEKTMHMNNFGTTNTDQSTGGGNISSLNSTQINEETFEKINQEKTIEEKIVEERIVEENVLDTKETNQKKILMKR